MLITVFGQIFWAHLVHTCYWHSLYPLKMNLLEGQRKISTMLIYIDMNKLYVYEICEGRKNIIISLIKWVVQNFIFIS